MFIFYTLPIISSAFALTILKKSPSPVLKTKSIVRQAIYSISVAISFILYGMGVKARMSSLKNRARELPGFVVSIGNITTGGTGKT
ncbi:hypothetical protein ACFL1N_15710, partial [Thermodesulfobacteriota bacterium]